MYEKCRYLLHLAVENATANELQYFSNKTKKQTNRNVYVNTEFQNSIERSSFFVPNNGRLNCSDKSLSAE